MPAFCRSVFGRGGRSLQRCTAMLVNVRKNGRHFRNLIGSTPCRVDDDRTSTPVRRRTFAVRFFPRFAVRAATHRRAVRVRAVRVRAVRVRAVRVRAVFVRAERGHRTQFHGPKRDGRDHQLAVRVGRARQLRRSQTDQMDGRR